MRTRLGSMTIGMLLLLVACGEAEPDAPGSTESGQGPPDEVVLTCEEGGGHSLSTDVIRPHSDGVHVVVDNRRATDPGMLFSLPQGGGGGRNAPPGTKRMVIPAAPGEMELACYPDDINEEPDRMTVEVVDPDGLYVDEQLDCDIISSMIEDYAEPPTGSPDQERVARERLSFGLRNGDEVRRAGYEGSNVPVWVVIRDGQQVAKTTLQKADGGWYTDGYDACDDFAT